MLLLTFASDIDIAFDHLLNRWSPDGTTLFAHPEGPPRGGMNDIEPIYAMALYIDMFKTVDPSRANDANFAGSRRTMKRVALRGNEVCSAEESGMGSNQYRNDQGGFRGRTCGIYR